MRALYRRKASLFGKLSHKHSHLHFARSLGRLLAMAVRLEYPDWTQGVRCQHGCSHSSFWTVARFCFFDRITFRLVNIRNDHGNL